MNKFSVTYGTGWNNTEPGAETIEAEYYKFDEGWVFFKDGDHKTLTVVKSSAVMSIRLI